MSLWTRINRFNGGLWSPLLDGRTDLEDYNSALRTCTGFIPLKYGPVERMWGFEYACDAKVNNPDLVEFRFDVNQSYVIETDGTYLRFFDSSQSSIGNTCVTVDIDDVQAFGSPYSYRYGELVKNGGTVYAYDNGFGTSTATNPFDANEWHALTETATTGIFIYEIPAHLSAWQSTLDKPHIAQINDVMYFTNESYKPFKLSRISLSLNVKNPPTVVIFSKPSILERDTFSSICKYSPIVVKLPKPSKLSNTILFSISKKPAMVSRESSPFKLNKDSFSWIYGKKIAFSKSWSYSD